MAAARIYRHKWVLVKLPIALVALAAMVALWRSLMPLPPAEITISSGGPDGVYHAHALKYVERFAEHGIQVRVLPSEGSVQNVARLRRLTEPVADLAFVQGGSAAAQAPPEAPPLNTLARVDIEPVWIFSRVAGVENLQQLQGLRVSLGPRASGTRELATQLLQQVRLSPRDLQDSDLGGMAAVEALRKGELDAVIMVSAPGSPLIRALMQMPGVQLVQLNRSAALIERMPHLQVRLIPAGLLDAQARLPARDTTILATSASLVARADLHPALQRLAAHVAQQVHSQRGTLHRAGEFPTLRRVEFPASLEARRTLAEGLPLLEARLPFWWAQVIERLLVICLPVALLAYWLARLVPAYLHWLVESRMVRWYGELKYIENDLARNAMSPMEVARNLGNLSDMERRMQGFLVPGDLMPRWFLLKQHIGFVRTSLLRRTGR